MLLGFALADQRLASVLTRHENPILVASPLFLGQQLKIDRAGENISALHEWVQAFLNMQPHRVTYQWHHKQPTQISVSAGKIESHVMEQAMLNAGIRIGECLHNLRSALDETIWLMGEKLNPNAVPPRTKRPKTREQHERGIRFPVTYSEKSWKEAKSSNLWHVPREMYPIIEALQPISGRHLNLVQQRLGVLNRLWIIDKHQTIPVVVTSVRLDQGIESLPRHLRVRVIRNQERTYDSEAELFCAEYADGIGDKEIADEMDMHLQFAFEISFDGTIPGLEGHTVRNGLDALYGAARTAFSELLGHLQLYGLVPPGMNVLNRPWPSVL